VCVGSGPEGDRAAPEGAVGGAERPELRGEVPEPQAPAAPKKTKDTVT